MKKFVSAALALLLSAACAVPSLADDTFADSESIEIEELTSISMFADPFGSSAPNQFILNGMITRDTEDILTGKNQLVTVEINPGMSDALEQIGTVLGQLEAPEMTETVSVIEYLTEVLSAGYASVQPEDQSADPAEDTAGEEPEPLMTILFEEIEVLNAVTLNGEDYNDGPNTDPMGRYVEFNLDNPPSGFDPENSGFVNYEGETPTYYNSYKIPVTSTSRITMDENVTADKPFVRLAAGASGSFEVDVAEGYTAALSVNGEHTAYLADGAKVSMKNIQKSVDIALTSVPTVSVSNMIENLGAEAEKEGMNNAHMLLALINDFLSRFDLRIAPSAAEQPTSANPSVLRNMVRS